jgi:predicted esterase
VAAAAALLACLGACDAMPAPDRAGHDAAETAPAAELPVSAPQDTLSGSPADAAAPDAAAEPAPEPAPSPFDSIVRAAAEGPLPDSIGVLMPRRFGAAPAGTQISDYLLYLPPGMERGGRWPVLLYLHGRSLRGNDLERVKRYGIPMMLESGRHVPFIVVAPQLPAGQRWVDTQRVVDLLQHALAPLPADADRVYVTGYSMGAGGAWRVAIEHPHLFAAAAAVAATTPEPTEGIVTALARLPVRVYHGSADADASYADAVRLVRALQRENAPTELVTLEGEGHDIVNEVYDDAALYQWLLSHRRTQPSNGS